MENTQDFLDRLDRLTFVSEEDKTLHTAEGFEISYNLELMGSVITDYPIQFIFRVRKEGVYVMSWGCTSNADNKIASEWWQRKYYVIRDLEYQDRHVKETLTKNEFKQLTGILI